MLRTKLRFLPYDSDEVGFISFDTVDLIKPIAALILNESLQGSCVAINRKLILPEHTLQVGQIVFVTIGKLQPVSAEINWVKNLDEDIVKIGVQYKK
jgi:hypothetical protein